MQTLHCHVCDQDFPRRNTVVQREGMPCPRCRRRAANVANRARRRSQGLCVRCGQTARPGLATCQACTDAALEHNRLTRAGKKRAGSDRR